MSGCCNQGCSLDRLRERLDQLLPTSPVAENFAATQPALLD